MRRLALCGVLTTMGCSGSIALQTVSFDFSALTQGLVLTASDDVDPNTPGIQTNISVATTGLRTNQTLSLSNSLTLDALGQSVVTTGVLTGDAIVFANYSLPMGRFTLRIAREGVALTESCDGKRCAELEVAAMDNGCLYDDPRHGATITQDLFPDPSDPFDPVEIDVEVSCYGVAALSNVALRVNGGLPAVELVSSTGRVTFARVPVAEGLTELSVAARTDADGADPQGLTSDANITVNTGRCLVSLEPDDLARLLAVDDTDGSTANGMQAMVDVVTDCAADSEVRVYLQGPADSNFTQIYVGTPTATDDPAGARFAVGPLDLPESVDGYDVTVIAQVEELAGKDGTTLESHYWVDSSAPSFVTVSPTDGCVGPANDLNSTVEGMQVGLFGATAGADAGSEFWALIGTPQACAADDDCAAPLVCRESICRYVAAVTNNAYGISDLTLPLGDLDIVYSISDEAGNRFDQNVSLYSFLDVATVTIADPLDGDFLGVADDLSGTTEGLQYQVVLTYANVSAESNGTLTVSGQAPLSFTPLGNGPTEIDVSLADGNVTLTARVQDACGNAVQSDPVTIIVASTPPVLTINAYENDSDLKDYVADGGTTGASSIDLDVYTGEGLQSRDVNVTLQDSTEVDGSCAGTVSQSLTATVAASSEGTVFSDVALAADINCLTVAVKDGVNTTTDVYVITRRTTTSIPTITLPSGTVSWGAPDDIDTDASNGLNQNVTVTLASAADVAGTLTLEMGTTNSVARAITVGESTINFAAQSFPQGTYNLIAKFRDIYDVVAASAPVSVTVTMPGPQVVITSPADPAYKKLADFNVSVAQVDAAVITGCALMIDNAQLGSDYAWGGSPLAIDPSDAVAEGTHSVRADCDDATPTTGVSQTVLVTIDDTAPTAPTFVDEANSTEGRIVFADGNYVNGDAADVSSVDGLQHSVTLRVGGGENILGFTVRLTATPQGQTAETYERLIPTSTVSSLDVTFVNVQFGENTASAVLPVVLDAVLIDRAGNVSGTTTVTLNLDIVAPTITQTVPSSSTSTLSEDEDVNVATDAVDIIFQYSVVGAVPDVNCSTNAGQCLALTLTPAPSNKQASDFPLLDSVSAGVTQFETLTFADGSYLAHSEISDAAGNIAENDKNFDVSAIRAEMHISVPVATITTLNAKFNKLFSLIASGLQTGTTVRLCSTLTPPGVIAPAACTWGSAGVAGGADAGYVVQTSTLQGTLEQTAVLFSGVNLSEGSQVLHAEAAELDGDPDIASDFRTFLVDTTLPVVTAVTFAQNSLTNDTNTSLRLGSNEGVANGGALQTDVNVAVTGAETNTTVTILSGTTAVGIGYLGADSMATVMVTLAEGEHVIDVQVSDTAGNPAASVAQDVEVDVTPPTVSVSAASVAVYTSLHATPDDNDTSGQRADDFLPLDIGVVLGGSDLASVSLQAYDAATAGSLIAGSTVSQTLVGTETAATVQAYPLHAGLNYLTATAVDIFGQQGTATVRQLYAADFYGPVLSLTATEEGGTPALACDNNASPCTMVTEAVVNNRAKMDRTQNDLLYTLTECDNSHTSIENCAENNITVSVQSRLCSATQAYANVFNSTFGTGTNYTTGRAYYTDAPNTAFDPGTCRELRLAATDLNGNASYSSPLYVNLNIDGLLVAIEMLDSGGQVFSPPVYLEADTDYGSTYNVANDASYQVNARVSVAAVNVASVPQTAWLDINGTQSSVSLTLSGGNYVGDFLGRTLAEVPSTNTVTATIDCSPGGAACASHAYSDVRAIRSGPRYQFSRCAMLNFAVPFTGSGSYNAGNCASAHSDASADVSGTATWTRAMDRSASAAAKGQSTTGMTFGAATDKAIGVYIESGAVTGQNVTLSSSLGGLQNATKTIGVSTGAECTGGPPCTVYFYNLEVPASATGVTQSLTVTLADPAGNSATPTDARCVGQCDAGDEKIVVQVDTKPPEAVSATVCIGESTIPDGEAGDTTNTEAAACSTYCAGGGCDRVKGQAQVAFAAPADDGTGDTAAAGSYRVLVVPRNLGTLTYPLGVASCSTLTEDSAVEANITVGTPATPGSTVVASVTGLYPHRQYCFRVLGIDDVGNQSEIDAANPDGKVAERALPLIHWPTAAALNPGADDSVSPAFANGTTGAGIANAVTNVGDMDGDGRDDFVVYNQDADVGPGSLDVYVSRDGASLQQAIHITPPTDLPSNALFGQFVAGGDFDADGLSDLAVCARKVKNPQALSNAGALYLYYGVSGTGLDTSRTNAGQPEPSDDPYLPSLYPDVALFGRATGSSYQSFFCNGVAMADVDGSAGVDIVVTTQFNSTGPKPRVYGFRGGHWSRFQTAKATRVVLELDVNNTAAAWDPATQTRPADYLAPSFVLEGPSYATKPTGAVESYPSAVAVADLNGDAKFEIVTSASLAAHGGDTVNYANRGEVYVYRGGSGLAGSIAGPDTLVAQQNTAPLMNLLRYNALTHFGYSLARIPAPRSDTNDSADWLLVFVNSSEGYDIVFKGTSLGESPGLVSRDGNVTGVAYPLGGAQTYWELDRTDWAGTTVAGFGSAIAYLGAFDGHGGIDIAVGARSKSTVNSVTLFSYDAATDFFVKRAILKGNTGFGCGVAGVQNYVSESPARTDLIVSSWTTSADGAVFVYR